SEYQQEYELRLRGKSNIRRHPYIAEILSGAACPVCGTEGEAVRNAVESRFESQHCPLCDSTLRSVSNQDSRRLSALDKDMARLREEINENLRRQHRLTGTVAEVEAQLANGEKLLAQFEERNAEALQRTQAEGTGVDAAMSRYREQIAELLKRK